MHGLKDVTVMHRQHSGSTREIGAQSNIVGEGTDDVSKLRPLAVVHHCSHDDVLSLTVIAQQQLQHRHNISSLSESGFRKT